MRLRKWTVRALLCGALLIAAATLATYAALRASLPPGPGVVDAHGLAHRVEIRFDAWRRPFVTADTLDDALYAQGWLHASDRLWQMEMLRRAATGRLSELLGASTIGSDKELWRMGVPQMGKQIEGNASPALRASVEAYVRGVNAALAAYTLPPPEFLLLQHAPAPWQPSDVYAMGA
ncbi:MAG: penicillin acylase family protein, partial [Candidatus Hydrogenedentes bacterium]|nr:penicillin acylase family protein [Candidatus Hydrogenedentota bacterium]